MSKVNYILQNKKPKTRTEYINKFPKSVQDIIINIEKMIYRIAPSATCHISYDMLGYKLEETFFFHFGVFKKHIGIYPIPNGDKDFQKKIEKYRSSKSTIKLQLNEDIPYDLILEIIKFRKNEECG